jgi:hypothetical protein
MAANASLGTYLNDHFAGATAGAELVRKIASNNTGTELGTFLDDLSAEIEADRRTLDDLMHQLRVERSQVKQVAGSLAEKVSRLRFAGAMTKSRELSQVMELDSLSMGIYGKLDLWRGLKALAASEPSLAVLDYDALAKRAQTQLERLEPYRRAAALQAFTGR